MQNNAVQKVQRKCWNSYKNRKYRISAIHIYVPLLTLRRLLCLGTVLLEKTIGDTLEETSGALLVVHRPNGNSRV